MNKVPAVLKFGAPLVFVLGLLLLSGCLGGPYYDDDCGCDDCDDDYYDDCDDDYCDGCCAVMPDRGYSAYNLTVEHSGGSWVSLLAPGVTDLWSETGFTRDMAEANEVVIVEQTQRGGPALLLESQGNMSLDHYSELYEPGLMLSCLNSSQEHNQTQGESYYPPDPCGVWVYCDGLTGNDTAALSLRFYGEHYSSEQGTSRCWEYRAQAQLENGWNLVPVLFETDYKACMPE